MSHNDERLVAAAKACADRLQHLCDTRLRGKECAEARADYQRLREAIARPAAMDHVLVDFPAMGVAGPLPMVDGKVTVPASTMTILAHHFRQGYARTRPAVVDEANVPQGLKRASDDVCKSVQQRIIGMFAADGEAGK